MPASLKTSPNTSAASTNSPASTPRSWTSTPAPGPDQRPGERQAAYCYYKEQLAILDPASIEFTPYLWHTLVDHAEVGTDDTITFTFRDGAKQTQHIGK